MRSCTELGYSLLSQRRNKLSLFRLFVALAGAQFPRYLP